MAIRKKYNALGRGLDALISTDAVSTQGSSTINEIAIDQIEANPNQPRREFDQEALQELATSIREIGIIQPITLRQVADNRFQIIAGERRWRASQIAGLKAIPAYIRTISDESVMEMALVENIQREDLNAIEIALGYQHLLDNDGMTQERVSERVGKSRAAIANYLRLLRLPAQIQLALQKKEVDMGHARALLALDSPSQQIKVFKEIQKHGYSVRKVEEMVNMLKNGDDGLVGAFTAQTKELLIPAAILFGLSIAAYIILACIYGWKYCVLFEMNETGIRHIQMEKQYKKAQALGWLTAMAGAAAGMPGTAGMGLLAATKNEQATEFSKVKRMRTFRAFHTIKLDSSLNHNQIYAESEDYDFVLEYISKRIPKNKSDN